MTLKDTINLRNRLRDELLRSTTPLSTHELAVRMPWRVMVVDHDCALLCHRSSPSPDVEVLECHRSWHRVQWRRNAQGHNGIYRHLRSMAERGEIKQVTSSRRGSFWVCAPQHQRQELR